MLNYIFSFLLSKKIHDIPVYKLTNVTNMANESLYIFEERIVTRVWVQERHNTGDTLDKISSKFRQRFKKNPRLAKLIKTVRENCLKLAI